MLIGFVVPGVWRISEVGPGDRELAIAQDIGWRELDLGEVDSKASLLDRLSKDLNLPEYFGHNWDALEECLIDQPERSLIVIRNAHKLIEHDPRSASTLSEILSGAGVAAVWVSWGPESVPAIPPSSELQSTDAI